MRPSKVSASKSGSQELILALPDSKVCTHNRHVRLLLQPGGVSRVLPLNFCFKMAEEGSSEIINKRLVANEQQDSRFRPHLQITCSSQHCKALHSGSAEAAPGKFTTHNDPPGDGWDSRAQGTQTVTLTARASTSLPLGMFSLSS